MYELQQDYFAYLHQVAIDAPAIVVPTFQDVVNQVATGRVARPWKQAPRTDHPILDSRALYGAVGMKTLLVVRASASER
jgi:hypothetical protein